jgi:hypothetical protein
MMRHIPTVGLVFLLGGGVAFGDTIRSSIPAAVDAEAAAQTRQRGRGENELIVPGIVLISGGAGLALLGVIYPSGAKCEETGGRNFGIQCGTTANKGLLFTGLGAAALGGYLIMRGEKQRNRPFVAPTAGGIVAGHRLSF